MDGQGGKLDAVFEGGGVKGIGLVGALSVVEAAGYELVNLAGTSAGAVVATLCAAGYSATEIKQIIMSLDLSTLTDTSFPGNIPVLGSAIEVLTQMGLYDGDVFLNLMRDLLERKNVRTFRDLLLPTYEDDDKYRFKVRIIASDVTCGTMLVLPQDIKDYGIAPEDLEVALAVRMSMSIPLFFKPVKLLNADHKTSYIVDGGLLSDYPVWLFDSSGPPEWPTFGFRLVQTGPPTVVRHDVHDPLSMLQALFGTATEAHDARYIATHDFARTIAIDTLHIGSTEFNLSPEQKEELYQSGVSAGQQFLAQWDFEQYKSLYRSGRPEPSRHEQALPKAPTVAVTSATAMTTATS